MTPRCRQCGLGPIAVRADLGPQPVTNRFPKIQSEAEFTHPLVLGQCETCGLVQLVEAFPASELLPRYGWITYNEPDSHLDALAERIAALPGLTRESTTCGASFKDDPLLDRLKGKGFTKSWRLDLEEDLGVRSPGAGLETIQDRLTPEAAARIAEKRPKADVVVARHILEHANDIRGFIEALRKLASPDGYVVFEAPDCERSLDLCDYTCLWEEHVAYYTPETFKRAFPCGGLSLVHYASYPQPLEDCLVGIGRLSGERKIGAPSKSVLEAELRRGRDYGQRLPGRKAVVRRRLLDHRREKGRIALFGAGHLAAMFVNAMEVADLFEFVADDNPNKKDLLMPGSKLPIVGSSELLREDIRLALLSLNPLSEDKVVAKNSEFTESGGEFASIFPASRRALDLREAEAEA